MVTSDCRPKVEIRPFCACSMHPVIIIGTVRSLWGRYHVPQNAFLVLVKDQVGALTDHEARKTTNAEVLCTAEG